MIKRKNLISCILSVVLTLLVWDLAIPKSETKIYSSVTRLHVLANSDSEYDQKQKYEVRDAITAKSGELMNITDYDSLSRELEQIAETVCGQTPVTVCRVKEYYGCKSYDGVMFPAGVYDSVKVIIGEGKGKNWWCVLFPPLCLSAATAEDGLTQAGIDREDTAVFTDTGKIKYKIRFKLLEIFSAFWE